MTKELIVISGKGGTGKTSIVASLAHLLTNHVLADCDVDAADLHLVLKPTLQSTNEFWCGKSASINQDKCISCGRCQELCRFDAITNKNGHFEVDKVSCEGCGVCVYFCPVEAIDFTDNLAGHWFVSETPNGPMVHAKLGTAEENSGKLVTMVRTQAKKIAHKNKADAIIVDGPPGIGCPVIASISGANLILIITEPTLSGAHDLQRVVSLSKHFKIPALVCINKADINPEITDNIKKKCQEEDIRVVGCIPYDDNITKAQVQCTNVVEYSPESAASVNIINMAKELAVLLYN